MRIYLLIITLLLATWLQAEVYRSVDESGNIVYSDKPSPDAEQIHVEDIQTIKGDPPPTFEYTPPKSSSASNKIYTSLQITSPQNNQVINDNAGNVSVQLSIEPGLLPGHRVYWQVDGNVLDDTGTQLTLTNVDRGTHQLVAVIKAPNGKEMAKSSAVSFTVKRHSVQHNPSSVGKPPPAPTPN